MAISHKNFDRQYRFAAGKGGQQGFEVGATSDAQPIPLKVSFSFQKTDLEEQNTGKITIWNLNKSHIATLNEEDCVVSFRAGYGNHLPLIFAGIVNYASTSDDGADQKTEIEVVDSLVEIRDTYVSVCYNGVVNWKRVIDDTASQMGIAVSYSYNARFSDIHNGFTFVGKAKDILTKACNCCGLSWSIQNGVLQIKRKGDTMSLEVYKLDSSSGLIGIPVRVVVAEDEATGKNIMGWDVTYLLNGAINIDDYVKLESKHVTGYFRVYSLEISGENLSGDWQCKARLVEVR